MLVSVSDSAVGSINFFLNVTNTVWPWAIEENCIAWTTLGPVVYVIVLLTPSESVNVKGLGNSIKDDVTGWNIVPVLSEPVAKSVYWDIALRIDTK